MFTVTVTTPGAIAGYPHVSDSAIGIASDIIHDLRALEALGTTVPASIADRLQDRGYSQNLDSLLGAGSSEALSTISMNVGKIHGGSAASVIAPDCHFEVAVVLPAGADPAPVLARAREIVAAHPAAELAVVGADTGDHSDPEHEMVHLLQETVTGLGWPTPVPVPDIAISDLRYWRYRNIPAFWYGSDGGQVSSANEYIDIDALLHLVCTYALAGIGYLSARPGGPTRGRRPSGSSIGTSGP